MSLKACYLIYILCKVLIMQIRKLVKETLVLGFSIGPWNLFDRKTRTHKFGRVPNQWGKVLLILLLPRSSTSRCLQFTNDCGKGPSNWLPLRFRLLKFFANVSGMVPWNVLFRKSNTQIITQFSKTWRNHITQVIMRQIKNIEWTDITNQRREHST